MRFIGRIFLLRIILHNIIISHCAWHFAYYFAHIMLETSASNTQASDIIEAEMEATSERDEILQFIKNSHRGIMKGYFTSN